MARQCGTMLITGTIGQLCFYQAGGMYYVRKKSSLSRERVLRDPRFFRTRVYASLLKSGSTLASEIYRGLSGDQRCHALFRKMTGEAMRLLRSGYPTTEAKVFIREWLKEQGIIYHYEQKEMPTVLRGKAACTEATHQEYYQRKTVRGKEQFALPGRKEDRIRGGSNGDVIVSGIPFYKPAVPIEPYITYTDKSCKLADGGVACHPIYQ